MANEGTTKEQKFYHDLQRNEIRTMRYLGVQYLVLERTPNLVVKVPISTVDYLEGQSVGTALQIVFTCPPNYPMEWPQIEIVEKHNVSPRLEMILRREMNKTLEHHLGLQMMVPVVTHLQMVLNIENYRSDNDHQGGSALCWP